MRKFHFRCQQRINTLHEERLHFKLLRQRREIKLCEITQSSKANIYVDLAGHNDMLTMHKENYVNFAINWIEMLKIGGVLLV